MQSRVKSLSQNTGAFVYTTGEFTKVYPVTTMAKAGETLAEFAHNVGIPTDLQTDLASYFTGRNAKFVKEAKRLRTKVTYAEKGRHNQNHAAEQEIRDLKQRWHNKMIGKSVPK
jgi:predicted GIY-YIG superfamily endonuclease